MMISPTIEQRNRERVRPDQTVVMRQVWSDLLFLHWEFDPALIQRMLPKGLFVDRFSGTAYVGVVPFRMEKVRPAGFPPVPKLSWFNELNLRTYVHDASGRPGVWFFSLDCDQWIAAEIAKALFHLPYQHAKMQLTVDTEAQKRHFSSKRSGDEECQNFIYQPLELPSKPSPYLEAECHESLQFFLAERYLLYSVNKKGTLLSGRVHHSPYQLRQAEVSKCSTRLFELEGLPRPQNAPVSQLMADPVEVEVFPLQRHGTH